MYVHENLGAVVALEDFVAPHFIAHPIKLAREFKAGRGWSDAFFEGEVVEGRALAVLHGDAAVARAVKGAESVKLALVEAGDEDGTLAVGGGALVTAEVDAAKAVRHSLVPAAVVEVAVGIAGGAHPVPAVTVDAGVCDE